MAAAFGAATSRKIVPCACSQSVGQKRRMRPRDAGNAGSTAKLRISASSGAHCTPGTESRRGRIDQRQRAKGSLPNNLQGAIGPLRANAAECGRQRENRARRPAGPGWNRSCCPNVYCDWNERAARGSRCCWDAPVFSGRPGSRRNRRSVSSTRLRDSRESPLVPAC